MSAHWDRPIPAFAGAPSRPHASARSTLHADSIVIGRFQGTVIVTLHGALDVKRLGGVFHDLIDGQGNLDVVADFRDVDRIDSSGVEVLRVAADHIAARGGALRVSGPSGAVFDALAFSGLTRLIDVGFEPEHRPRSLERPSRSDGRQRSIRSHPAGNAKGD
jgi:anti-anti-sigma factor